VVASRALVAVCTRDADRAASCGPSTSPLGLDRMPLRIVGALMIALACVVMTSALYLHQSADELAVAMSTAPAKWDMPVSKETFLERSRLHETFTCSCAVLAGVAGLGMLFRKRWSLYVAGLAAVLLVAFPWLTRLLGPDLWFEAPDPLGLLFGSLFGLVAALASVFRPARGVDA
jgi:hypothetical protein